MYQYLIIFLQYIFIIIIPVITVSAGFNGSPIVLIPGDAGSQLFAKLNKSTQPHYFCSKTTTNFFQLWLDLKLLAPLVLDCWVDNMLLIYNNVTRTTSNTIGVTTKIPDMGDTSAVEYLDRSNISVSLYYATIVNNAIQWGYTRNKNIRGVPYDFRKAPNEQNEFFDDFKALIEQTYYANGNKRVVVIGHSMGNPYSLYFYNRQTKAWKNKFIRSHISLAAPWGGSAKIMRLLASGYNMDHYRILVSPITLRTQQRSMPSTAFLMPSDKFWPSDEPIIMTPERNYTSYDYLAFFQDIKFRDGWDMYLDTRNLTYDLKAPGVEIHCIHGVGLKTPEKFVYGKKSFPDYQPEEIMGDGDGTVNARSHLACQKWSREQSQPVYTKIVQKSEHLEMLYNQEVIDYIKRVVFEPDVKRFRHKKKLT